jgi:hypothetical protein
MSDDCLDANITYDCGAEAIMSAGKDNPTIQRARLKQLAEEIWPGARVYFDPDQPVKSIRMRVDDSKNGNILMVSSGYWDVSRIADKNDDELRLLLRSWAKKQD